MDDLGPIKQRLTEQALRGAHEIVDHSGSVIGQGLPASASTQVAAWREEWSRGVRRLV